MKIYSKDYKGKTTIKELVNEFITRFFDTTEPKDWEDYPDQIDLFITYIKDNYIINKEQQNEFEQRLFDKIEKEIKKREKE